METFLRYTKDIVDVDSFIERVNSLKEMISKSKRILSSCDYNRKKVLDKNNRFFSSSVYPLEESKDFHNKAQDILLEELHSQEVSAKELIHNCEDELEWLTSMIKVLINIRGLKNLNFDPKVNHA